MSDHPAELEEIAPGLATRVGDVDGVVGAVLGGSRARGDHRPDSDYDIGIYYSGSLDIDALQSLADEYSSSKCEMSELGEWGPWVDGGGWLKVNDTAIDLIYRNLDRVRQVWTACQVGEYRTEMQPGHPLGFWSHSYVGELALGIILEDPLDHLSTLQAECVVYPPLLADALSAATWEASFSIANARKAVDNRDVAYVAGCLFKAVGILTQAIHGHNRRWLVNEKGAVRSTTKLPSAPAEFATRVDAAFRSLGPAERTLDAACDRIESLVSETLRSFSESAR